MGRNSKRVLIKMKSTGVHPEGSPKAGQSTGYYKVTDKNPSSQNTTEKLEFMGYDPVIQQHVLFKEAKIK